MKFSDIKKHHKSSYHITVFWKDLSRQLQSYQKEYDLDFSPNFQRGYVWTTSQQISYVEYKLAGGTGSDQIYFNCPNWLGSVEMDDQMVIVDGKQRIDAVLRFLDNQIPAFGCLYQDFEDRLRGYDTLFTFNINDLVNPKDVYQWYLQMNSGGTIHTKQELDKVRKLISLHP